MQSGTGKMLSNILISFVGSGILGLPYAFSEAGMVQGSFVLALSGFIAYLNMLKLTRSRKKANSRDVHTYSELAQHYVGQWVRIQSSGSPAGPVTQRRLDYDTSGTRLLFRAGALVRRIFHCRQPGGILRGLPPVCRKEYGAPYRCVRVRVLPHSRTAPSLWLYPHPLTPRLTPRRPQPSQGGPSSRHAPRLRWASPSSAP